MQSKFMTYVAKIKQDINEISVDELAAKLTQKEAFTLIDVREQSEWDKGSLPTAVHSSRGVLEGQIEKITQDSNGEIVLFCAGGARSALAARNLQEMGYTNVRSLAGGYGAWVKAQN